MNTKQKWVMIAGWAVVWLIIILNFMFKPSVPEYVVQVIILLGVQIWGMRVFKNKKPIQIGTPPPKPPA